MITDRTEAQAVAAILAHALQHEQATADCTAPHWVWLAEAGGEQLHRVYPLQGLRVRQDDVTLFSH